MPVTPVTADLVTRVLTLAGYASPLVEQRLKDIHAVFDWLRSMASTPEEKAALDAEEAAFLRTYGDGIVFPEGGVSVKSLVAWALSDVRPSGSTVDSPLSGESVDVFKSLLYRHITRKKAKAIDRIIYLLRILNRDKVDLDGRPKPPFEPAKRDLKTYHAGYNDRTAHRIEHDNV